eukprot:TRINITY_DN794_c0_g1_i2.p1 TRINITY_DN794_c0_g1~~TRINITY_DN794_c0_g1_i2.p1  ORF type:complete len:171 (-),score=36.38 TRINITY_DN794_c0_g1_i2:56-568(-)
MFRKFFLFSILIVVAFSDHINFENCCTSSACAFVPSNIDMTPYPPFPGSNINVTILGKTAEPINGGNVKLLVYIKSFVGWLKAKELSDPTCKLLPCSDKIGQIDLSLDFPIPSSVPKGSYRIEVEFGETSVDMACLMGYFTISKKHGEKIEEAPMEEELLWMSSDPPKWE